MKLFLTITAAILFSACLIGGLLYYNHSRAAAVNLEIAMVDLHRSAAELSLQDVRVPQSEDAWTAAVQSVELHIREIRKLKMTDFSATAADDLQVKLDTARTH